MNTLTTEKINNLYSNSMQSQNPQNLESIYFDLTLSNDKELKSYYSVSLHNWAINQAKYLEIWWPNEKKAQDIIRVLRKSLKLSPEDYFVNFSIALTYKNFGSNIDNPVEALKLHETALEFIVKAKSIKQTVRAGILYATILMEIAGNKAKINTLTENSMNSLKYKYLSSSSKEQLLAEFKTASTSLTNDRKFYSDEEIENLYLQALAQFDHILKLKPNNQWANYHVGRTYYNLFIFKDNIESKPLLYKALAKLNKARKLGHKDIKLFVTLGNVLRNISEYENHSLEKMEQSVEIYREAYKINDHTYETLYGLGASLSALGEMIKNQYPEKASEFLTEASSLFQKSIDLDIRLTDSITSLGYSLSLLASTKPDGQEIIFEKAIEKFKQVLAIYPENERTLSTLSFCLKDYSKCLEGKKSEEVLEEAIIIFRKLAGINPDNHRTLMDLGKALVTLSEKKGNTEATELLHQAKEVFEKAVNIEEDNYLSIAYCGLIYTELLMRSYDYTKYSILFFKAVEKFNLALKINPSEPMIMNMWVNSLTKAARKKDFPELPQLIEESLEKIFLFIESNNDINSIILYLSSLMRISFILQGPDLSNLSIRIIQISTDCYLKHPDNEDILHIWSLSVLSFSSIHGVTNYLNLVEEDCLEFLKNNPNNAQILNNVARVYQTYSKKLKKGFNENIDKAINYYSLALNLEPENSNFLLYMGSAYLEKYNKTKQEQYLDSAFEAFYKAEKDNDFLVSENSAREFDRYVAPDISFNIAKIYSLQGKAQESLIYLEKSLKNNLNFSRQDIIEASEFSNLLDSEEYWKIINKYKLDDFPKPIFFTEDENIDALKLVLEASGFNLNNIEINIYQGCGRLDVIKQLSDYFRKRDPKLIIFIHRDRDFLSDKYIKEQIKECNKMGVNFFVPKGTDIESYFLSPEHLSSLYPEIPVEIAEILIEEAIDEKRLASIEKFKGSIRQKGVDIETLDTTKTEVEIENIINEKFNSNKFRYSHGKTVLNHLKSKIHKEYKFKPVLFQKTEYISDPYLKNKSKEIKMKLEKF